MDLATDPANCGACGHGCQGGACVASVCQPVTLFTTNDANRIAVDATSVYWVAPEKAGAVMKGSIDGGTPTMLAPAQQAWGIAVDATSVYWTERANGGSVSNGAVKKAPIQGGVPTTLASAQFEPLEIAIDASNVYWTVQGTVMKVPIQGGTPTLFASPSASLSDLYIAVDAANLYWQNGQTLTRVATSSSAATALFSASGNKTMTGGLAVDATAVYWGYGAGGTPCSILEMPTDGSGPAAIGTLPAAPFLAAAVDGEAVYGWSNTIEPGTARVLKVPKDGGSLVVLASPPSAPTSLAIDATSVYWADAEGIKKVAK